MHEFSTAVNIIKTIVSVAEKNNAVKILKIELMVGEFTMLNIDQLSFAFEIAAEGTLAEGAEVLFEKQPGLITCQECGYQGEIESSTEDVDHFIIDLTNIFECPECHSNKTEISGGRDIYVKNIEVELPEE